MLKYGMFAPYLLKERMNCYQTCKDIAFHYHSERVIIDLVLLTLISVKIIC